MKKSLAIFALAVITLAVTACNNPFFPKPREISSSGRGTDTNLSVAIAVDVDGRDVTLTAVVTGSGWGALSYQWYANDVESSEGGRRLSGETEESYEPPTDIPGTTYYYVDVRAGSASAVSNTVGIIVNEEGYEGEPIEVIISDAVAMPAVTVAAETDDDGRKVTLTAFATVDDEGELSYQWYRSATDRSDRGTALARETRTTYTPPVTSNGTVYYYVRATNTLRGQTASASSHTVKVTVQDGEVIEVIVSDTVETPSVSVTAFTSGGVTLTATASVSDGGALSYRWYKNTSEDSGGGTPIVGATETTYEPPPGGDGTVYYYVKVTNTLRGQSADAVSNTVKIVTRYGEIVITEIIVSATAETPSVNVGAANDGGYVTVTASASVSDGGSLSYRWYKNTVDNNKNGALVAGAVEASYAPPTDVVGTAYYYVRVTNTLNGQTAEATSVTVRVIVQSGGITEVVVSEAVRTPVVSIAAAVSGRTVTIMAAASAGDGGTLSYRWYRSEENSTTGGTVITGVTGIIYAPPTDVVGTAYYYVEVTNSLNGQTASAVSNTVRVTVPADDGAIEVETFHIDIPAVAIDADVDGRDVVITAAASVSDGGTLSYQWYRNSKRSINSGAAIDGATGETYEPPTDTAGVLYYYVKVTNTLKGRTAVATSNIIGVTVPAGDGAVEILNVETSDADIPTVSIAAAVTGRSVTIMASASVDDGGTLSYQWYRNEENNKNGTVIGGATGILYAPPTDSPGITYYYAQVTNTVNGQTAAALSNTVGVVVPSGNGTIEIIETLDVEPPTVSIDADVTGTIVTITADAFVNDGGTLSYRWYSNTQRSAGGGTLIPGETGVTYMPPTNDIGTLYYYVRVTNALNGKTASATSNIVGVTVPSDNGAIQVERFDVDIPAVSITANVTGRNVTITAAASVSDGGTLTYQWYRNTQNNKNGTEIGGATGITYAPPTGTPGTAYYYVIATNTLHGKSAEAFSNTIGVTVPVGNGAIEIETFDAETPEASISADVNGRDVTLTADAYVSDGGTLSYQWYSNNKKSASSGTAIAGATGVTYAPQTSVPGTMYYYVRVTNTLNGKSASAASNILGVTVPAGTGSINIIDVEIPDVDIPVVTIAAAVTGRSVTIIADASVDDGGTLSYQWYRNEENSKNGTLIEGATRITYAPPTGVPGTTYYYIIATNTLNGQSVAASSNVLGVTVPAEGGNIDILEVESEVEIPTIAITADTVGRNVTLTADASVSDGGTITYQWYSNIQRNKNGSAITNATGVTYTPPTDDAGTMYYYCLATNTLNGYTARMTSNIIGVTVPDSGDIDVIEAEIPVVTVIASPPGPYGIGHTVTLSASPQTVSDGGIVTLQWYSNSANSNQNGTAIGGQTSLVYIAPTGSLDTTYYYVVATNTLYGKTASAVSNAVTVDVVVTEISSASVSVTAPVKSAQPDFTAHTSDRGYGVGTVAWATGGAAFSGSTFAGGAAYAASVTLTAEEGYEFDLSFTGTINGNAGTSVTRNSASSVTLSFTFALTSLRDVLSIEIVDQPTRMAYQHGEALDLNGLKLTINYDDTDGSETKTLAELLGTISADPAIGGKLRRTLYNGQRVKVTVGGKDAYTDGTLTVNTKELTVTGVEHTKVYNGNTAAASNAITNIEFAGKEFNDDVYVDTVTGVYTSASAGTVTMNITGGTLAGNVSDMSNYTLPTVNNVAVTGGITRANPAVTWPTGPTVGYGTGSTTLSSVSITGGGATGVGDDGSLTGEFRWTTPTNNIGDAGPRTHNMTYVPASANYNTRTRDVEITVNQKTVTIAVGNPSRTLIPFDSTDTQYGTTATFTVTVTGLVSGHTVTVNTAPNDYGLSLTANNTGIGGSQRTVTMTYDGTAVDSTSALSVGLAISQTANPYYRLTGGPAVAPAVIDGQAAARAIPVTQANITQFNTYANTVAGRPKHYKLTQDVPLEAPAAGDSNWTPIASFTGSFDGQGNTITGLTGTNGMFSTTSGSMVIQNLGLRNVSISNGIANGVGSVVGYGSGTVQNCYVTGSISSRGQDVGGVVGYTYGGTVQNCYSTCNVSGASTSVGGVVGRVGGGGTVQNCYATGSIINSIFNTDSTHCGVGGVVGILDNANGSNTVQNCYATGSVSGTNSINYGSLKGSGGVVGSTRYGGSIARCVALNTSITTSYSYNACVGRVWGLVAANPAVTASYNYGKTISMSYGSGSWSPNSTTGRHNDKDGADTTTYKTETFWRNTVGWNLTDIWEWDSDGSRLILRNMPTGAQNHTIP